MAKAEKRIYQVGPRKIQDGGGEVMIEEVSLVWATSQAQAINHVVRNTFAAAVATQREIVDYLAAGGKIETAGDDPQTEMPLETPGE